MDTSMREPEVVDNVEEHRFEIVQNGDRAELIYLRTPKSLVLIHTEVPPSMRGGGVGGRLVEAAVADAKRTGLQIIARCPFARAYLKRHPIDA